MLDEIGDCFYWLLITRRNFYFQLCQEVVEKQTEFKQNLVEELKKFQSLVEDKNLLIK